jgi:hypothetical protein
MPFTQVNEALPVNSTSARPQAKKVDSLLHLTILGQGNSFQKARALPHASFHFVIIAVFALTVGACSSTYIVRCKDGDHLAIHDSLYFGTAKPDGVVSSEDWARFLESEVTPRFPQGLTSSRTSGQWRGADGEIVREDSHVLQLLHPDDAATEKAIREVVDTYKTQFQQQAVLRIRSYACASF